ncbi:hypothetical protein Baya_14604 [Bagarius yarrelli]|uniref:Uncharacterized protein n=1 Tax=Bagarius yarrelli TaxID=175774 RepID=A0A556V9F2_BAGYA|nr:hypothetical protein Baya_14604 [Bagarius yarrelli]
MAPGSHGSLDAVEINELSKDSVSIPEDPTAEIGDISNLSSVLKLEKKPVPADLDSDSEESEDSIMPSFLRKNKRGLSNFKNSFFSGCTPVREES